MIRAIRFAPGELPSHSFDVRDVDSLDEIELRPEGVTLIAVDIETGLPVYLWSGGIAGAFASAESA